MLYRKAIYISLAVILIVGLAAAYILYRTPVHESLQEAGNAALKKEEKDTAKAIPVPSESESGPGDIRDNRQDKYPFVMKLIRNASRGPSFGAFRVEGIIAIDTAPESSRAIIEDLETGVRRTYRINDELPDDSLLVSIRQDYVILQKSGVRKRIYCTQGGESTGGAMRANRALPREGYRKIGDNEFALNPYRVFRGDADRVLDFSMDIQSRDGNMEGIRVSGVKDNTLAHALGLKDGDVLLEVNRRPVDSLLSSVKACINAYHSDNLHLKVQRDGRVVTLTYNLFWEGQGSWTPADVINSKAVSSLLDNGIVSNLF